MARKFDLVIIGGGPGGYTAALKAAEFGMKAVVIEAKKIGGTCVNRGCIPTKALLHASNMFHMMQNCDEFGVSTDFISFDFAKMQRYKREAVIKYRESVVRNFERLQVETVHGTATLRRDRTVEVELAEGGKEFFQGTHVIIATGALPIMSHIPGANLPGVWDSDRLLAAQNWNFDRLTILGGGVIAVELATIFNNLCAHVTIIEKQKHLMAPMDDIMSIELEKELRRKGIDIYCDATVTEIREEENGLWCTITPNEEGEPVKMRAGQVLMAIGRRPNITRLMGNDVSLKMQNGKIAVSEDFETSEPGVYAIGDVCTKNQLAHVAAAEATYVVEKLAGRNHSIRLKAVPSGMFVSLPIVPNCIYTSPEIATVGITEEGAKQVGLKVRCGHFSMRENGKSIISGTENGFIRLVFEAYSNTIVGAQMMCPRATDMIGEIAMAIANGLTAEQMSFAMRAHPTYNEGIGLAIQDAMHHEPV
ncbi:dihydrolipoyl dehydrogenase [Lacrimispora sp. 210928-DFI.3.58]|uniref:dihydrolipoyl dehydrogenase n=1 Tax=Lacrimispora sp. 210928-DFI.3.58 TaxID=2883214 RepID=UPI001D083C2B|nr:dihydrolipoyl dehydrogenase [Lacrimispora sp. 210928-DFI.3.58]MCB7320319.1 dihydrolipoyl dehydrogenase [Lacrimispora sp. 210928-DFI.3.58]